MSSWTHASCTECYATRHQGCGKREVLNATQTIQTLAASECRHGYLMRILKEEDRRDEICCYCGIVTRSGLYDRNDPQLTPCRGRNNRVHEEAGRS